MKVKKRLIALLIIWILVLSCTDMYMYYKQLQQSKAIVKIVEILDLMVRTEFSDGSEFHRELQF